MAHKPITIKMGPDELFDAINKGNLQKVIKCLEAGVSVNVRDKDGWTPLHRAAENDDTGIVLHLLEKGADPDVPDKDGLTPLNRAAGSGHADTVTCLLENGADPDVPDKDGTTPLHWAAIMRHADTVTCLLEKGANPDVKNQSGTTAVQIIVDRAKQEKEEQGKEGFVEIIEWFKRTHSDLLLDWWTADEVDGA